MRKAFGQSEFPSLLKRLPKLFKDIFLSVSNALSERAWDDDRKS